MHDEVNPFSPAKPANIDGEPAKVAIRPIQLLYRSKALMGDQYWLFLGITFVAMLIGSFVPFGLAMGPMMIGIFYCFAAREQGREVDFNILFKGFDKFLEGFLAMLMMMAASVALMVPFVVVAVMMAFLTFKQQPGGGGGTDPTALLFLLLLYPTVILVSVVVYLPFTFTFQLIAERDLSAWEAVKTSFAAAFKNILGIAWMMIVFGLISFLAALACYIPALLLMPITFGALHVLYRDIFDSDVKASPFADDYSPFR